MVEAQGFALFLARLLMGSVFVFSAIGKLRRDDDDMQAIIGLHLPFPNLIAWIVGTCEVIGATMLAVGIGARLAAVLLSLFLLFVSFAFLRFWTVPDHAGRFAETNAFLGNLGLIGGLIFVAVFGPGPLAIAQQI